MKLIPLEEVEKFLIGQYGFRQFQINTLKEIPAINPIAMIDEMIEEIHKKADNIDPDLNIHWEEELDKLQGKKIGLQELKSRLLNNK